MVPDPKVMNRGVSRAPMARRCPIQAQVPSLRSAAAGLSGMPLSQGSTSTRAMREVRLHA